MKRNQLSGNIEGHANHEFEEERAQNDLRFYQTNIFLSIDEELANMCADDKS